MPELCAPRGCHTPAYPCFVNLFRAWFVFLNVTPLMSITVTPLMSISAGHCAMCSCPPAMCHSIRVKFFYTEWNALCMSHVLMCRGSLYSKASSSKMRCSSIAVYVPLCAIYLCCDTFGMSCLRHIACNFLRTQFLHILRSVSTCIFAQRSTTELISAVLFLTSAFSHRHFWQILFPFPACYQSIVCALS